MKLGIGTFAYPWAIGLSYFMPEDPMDAFNFIRTCSDVGVHLVQIADNLPLHQLSIDERDKLYQHALKLGVDIEVGTRGLKPDNIKLYLEIARQFNSPILRVVIDKDEFKPDINEINQIISQLLPEFEAAGVILAIENHDRFKSYELADIIRIADSPFVGICLDTVNSFGALEGPEVVVENLGPYTVNLHVKDFTINRIKSNMGFNLIGTIAGEGMLNVPWLLKKLKDYGKEVNVILEVWMPPEERIKPTLLKEQEWVEKSIINLKKHLSE